MPTINYSPLWETMKLRNVTKYQLVAKYGFSNGTIDRLRSNDHISTYTIARLCCILECQPNDIFRVEWDGNSKNCGKERKGKE
ncbi:MAG: helix-turn-helix transcriptional regulator [Erysipelotrichales bacterium]|nr:helix-turn-helix transcriptional regulator [Erysipelotrichales bacterium]MBQ4374477.1 helix-turn-helix transcriptional regulator [Erysipelotrichales bacterium]